MSSLPPETVLRFLMWRNTDKSLRLRWRFLALIGLLPLLALAQTAPPARPFQRLNGCAYKPQRWDDGDSFHVILPDQKEGAASQRLIPAGERSGLLTYTVYASMKSAACSCVSITLPASSSPDRIIGEEHEGPLPCNGRWR